MNTFEKLMRTAEYLGERKNTEWAEKYEYIYDRFADAIEILYEYDVITAEEHDKLALEAFYDYDDLKCDYDVWG